MTVRIESSAWTDQVEENPNLYYPELFTTGYKMKL